MTRAAMKIAYERYRRYAAMACFGRVMLRHRFHS